MKMTFSIIIPCYKVEAYIRECLDSVLAQKVESWEAICTDDGSPDGTGAILDEYAAKDSRIKVIHQTNAGLSAARNAAMALATGEWLLYLDSDDVLSPWALKTYVKMAEKFPQADILRAEMATSTTGVWNWGSDKGEIVGLDVHDRVTGYGIDGYFQRMIFRRSVYGDIPFVGMSWCEERPYVAKCLARAKFVVDTPVVAYGFRAREGSITHRKMTLDECLGYLDATHDCMRIYRDCGKLIDADVMRDFMMRWMEFQPWFIEQFLPRINRRAAWDYWFRSLGEADDFAQAMSLWRRFTIVICRVLPFRIVPMVLCYFPHWLKLKGLHR